MKWYHWILTAILIAAIIFIFYMDAKRPGYNDLQRQVDAKEMVIASRDKQIVSLIDSIKRSDSTNSIYHEETVKQKARAESYRTKYEGLRSLRTSRSADTLKAVLVICDSTVLNQDTTINRLEVENTGLREVKQTQMVLADSLVSQVKDLKFEVQLFKDENKKSVRKEKWRRVWRTARDIGIGVIAFIIGKGA